MKHRFALARGPLAWCHCRAVLQWLSNFCRPVTCLEILVQDEFAWASQQRSRSLDSLHLMVFFAECGSVWPAGNSCSIMSRDGSVASVIPGCPLPGCIVHPFPGATNPEDICIPRQGVFVSVRFHIMKISFIKHALVLLILHSYSSINRRASPRDTLQKQGPAIA